MAYPMGEAKLEPLRVDFDRCLELEFDGSDIASDAASPPTRWCNRASLICSDDPLAVRRKR